MGQFGRQFRMSGGTLEDEHEKARGTIQEQGSFPIWTSTIGKSSSAAKAVGQTKKNAGRGLKT